MRVIQSLLGVTFWLIFIATTVSCSPSKRFATRFKATEERLNYHLGVSVFDFESQLPLLGWQDDRHFNPASNTKIYTLFACLNALGDSLPGVQYRVSGDTLLFRGTGDPSFLHPDLPESSVLNFLKSSEKKLVFCSGNWTDSRFGPGWAWDDYNDYYQTEKGPFPAYGNVLRLTGDSMSVLRAFPAFWNTALKGDGLKPGIVRDELANVFRFSGRPLPIQLRQDIPVITSDPLTVKLLNFALGREVGYREGDIDGPLTTRFSVPADTVYKMMMYESDNMLAEHLLYAYATTQGLNLNSREAIEHALGQYFTAMPDSLVWRDGSGLSRYNLFTPRTTVEVLNRMMQKFPQERVLSLFPQGGKSGTLQYIFKDSAVQVFAKSGSFSNNYSLSGYLISKKGKLLVFSVMNNNFAYPIRDLQKETERILIEVYERY
jgi:D-alanyl-D-alanine carboxypeptidase/D-alanyl-D-alanine-endopeptidase (penicillin-binding protein 4)